VSARSGSTAIRPQAGDPTAGRAVGRAPRSLAELDPLGRSRPGRAPRPSHHRRDRGAAPVAQGERRAPPSQRDPQGGECFFRPGDGPDKAEVVRAVEALRDRFGIAPVLGVLGVAASTYYGWLAQQRDPSPRRRANAEMLAEIRTIHDRSGATHGAPRVHATLHRRGHHVSRKRVERLMREAGLQGAFLRKRWRVASTRQNQGATPAPDLVNRDFTAAAPDRLWVADATRIPCGEGVFWLAAVRDAFSNRIVGWRCSDRVLFPCRRDLAQPGHQRTRQVLPDHLRPPRTHETTSRSCVARAARRARRCDWHTRTCGPRQGSSVCLIRRS
jgi:hypothetical protein